MDHSPIQFGCSSVIELLSERLILTSFSAHLAAGINVSVHLLPTIHNDCN